MEWTPALPGMTEQGEICYDAVIRAGGDPVGDGRRIQSASDTGSSRLMSATS